MIGAWWFLVLIIGILFIVMFYLVSASVVRAGITRTAVASRMSLVIPVLFSVLFFNETLNWIKTAGILTALAGLFLSLLKIEQKSSDRSTSAFMLPLIIFFGAGLVDSLIKYCQELFLTNRLLPLFSSMLFIVAGVSGFLIFFTLNKERSSFFSFWTLLLGVLLGLVNYGSIFFFVSALNKSGMGSASVFAINHIGIVLLTLLVAYLFFQEKIKWFNLLGILLSIKAILLLT